MTRLSIGAILVIIGSIIVIVTSKICTQNLTSYVFSYTMDPTCTLIIYFASGILVIFGIIIIFLESLRKKSHQKS
jgi:uncharacterized membrane protein